MQGVITTKLGLFDYVPSSRSFWFFKFCPRSYVYIYLLFMSVTASNSTPKWCFQTQSFAPTQMVGEQVTTYNLELLPTITTRLKNKNLKPFMFHLPRKRTISIMIIVRNTLFQNLATQFQILSWKILCHLQPHTQTHKRLQTSRTCCRIPKTDNMFVTTMHTPRPVLFLH